LLHEQLLGLPGVIVITLKVNRAHLAHAVQHIGLALIVSVRTHTQVHLLWIGVGLEGLRDAENRIFMLLTN
jgi:hypothetical protein